MPTWILKHRDRLAFIKIVSGTFKRNAPYLHVRNGKKVKSSQVRTAFFAEKKEIVEISYPGDIVGIHDTGNFKIGDTLTEGEQLNFKGIAKFLSRALPLCKQCRPDEIQTTIQRFGSINGRGSCAAIYLRHQWKKSNRNGWSPSIRSNSIST